MKYKLFAQIDMRNQAQNIVEFPSKMPKNRQKRGGNSPRVQSEPKKTRKLPKYVIEENGKWYVRRSFPGQRLPNGKLDRIQLKRRCEPQTADQAKYLAKALESLVHLRLSKSGETPTLAEYIDRYLDAKIGTVSTRTMGYLHDRGARLKETSLAQQKIIDIKAADIQRVYNKFRDTGSLSVLEKVHQLLSAVLEQAVKWEDLERNPCKAVLVPRVQAEEVQWFNKREAKTFLAECRKCDQNIIFEFALETGMRPSEYLALTWRDVDLDNRLITINKAIAFYLKGGGFEIKETKTKGSRRTVEVSGVLRDRLLRQRELIDGRIKDLRQRLRRPLLLSHLQRKGANYQKRKMTRVVARQTLADLEAYNLVFPSENGLPRSPNNLNRRDFKDLIEKTGLNPEDYAIYSLRHTMITLSLAAGANIKAVSEKAGTSPETLWKTYVHAVPSMRKEVTRILTDELY
jgi:integrase